jgi:hypothetical protein
MDRNIPSGVYVYNQVDNLLLSYNLTSIINFPTRVQNTSAVAIYNIFIDISQFESYTATPVLCGLSDHGAQLLMISTDFFHMPIQKSLTVRELISTRYPTLLKKLSTKSCDTIFNNDDVNAMLNSFLNI